MREDRLCRTSELEREGKQFARQIVRGYFSGSFCYNTLIFQLKNGIILRPSIKRMLLKLIFENLVSLDFNNKEIVFPDILHLFRYPAETNSL